MIQKEIKQNKIIHLSFDEARKIVREKGFKNRREHEKWAKSEKRPKNIPSRPDHIYKEWIDWPDYLGNNNKANQDKNKEYWSFEKAREFAHGLGFKNREQYYEWHRSQNPSYMPSRPESTYKNKGWKGWTDFLDTGNKFGQLEPLPFEEAKRIIQERHFTSQDAYNIWSASGKRPKNIPSHPYTVYKEDWKGWTDFLGYEVVEPLPYEEAKEFMHNLKPRIKSNEEFYKWSMSGKRPKNIPEAPSKVYKNKGWIDWPHFLGYEGLWTIEKVKGLLRDWIKSGYIYQEDEIVLWHILTTRGLLNLQGRHGQIFRNLLKGIQTTEGREALEKYVNSDSELPPTFEEEDEEIGTASSEELSELVEKENDTNPLDYGEIKTAEQILTNSKRLESYTEDIESMQFYVNKYVRNLWASAFQNEKDTVLRVANEEKDGNEFHDTFIKIFKENEKPQMNQMQFFFSHNRR